MEQIDESLVKQAINLNNGNFESHKDQNISANGPHVWTSSPFSWQLESIQQSFSSGKPFSFTLVFLHGSCGFPTLQFGSQIVYYETSQATLLKWSLPNVLV